MIVLNAYMVGVQSYSKIALFDSIVAVSAFLVLFIMSVILNIRHRKLRFS